MRRPGVSRTANGLVAFLESAPVGLVDGRALPYPQLCRAAWASWKRNRLRTGRGGRRLRPPPLAAALNGYPLDVPPGPGDQQGRDRRRGP